MKITSSKPEFNQCRDEIDENEHKKHIIVNKMYVWIRLTHTLSIHVPCEQKANVHVYNKLHLVKTMQKNFCYH